MAKKEQNGKQELSYEEAFQELKTIADAIGNDAVSVDALAEKVRRASQLMAICQDKLRTTETELDNILKQMSGGGS
jgi:exodeoxyribonuclease VII small subunit